ncbi:nitronate monooxygenase [Tsuneonella suprasediminis]|uniref:NAD(P)H-dependent flavin oxidoreductase n=1 Tax=Tsuneonella suprasediminis TaxID=2306996 RepID=UPI002F9416E2
MSRLPFADRLRLPILVGPMLRVSGIEMTSAACAAGVIGSFPTANCESLEELDAWLGRLSDEARTNGGAPFCPNLIMRRDPGKLMAEADIVVANGAEVVITSVGSPAAVIPKLHAGGCMVLADVARVSHARRAVEAGADGLVLLTAGAGGHTGWINPFAFVRAVRDFFDGPIVLAGGIADGVALRAANMLGADLASMGTRFIACAESIAVDGYKQMLADSTIDDIRQTRAFTGLPVNVLEPSIRAVGLDPDELDETVTVAQARERFGGQSQGVVIKRWTDVWSAGHSVAGVARTQTMQDIVDQIANEYNGASA